MQFKGDYMRLISYFLLLHAVLSFGSAPLLARDNSKENSSSSKNSEAAQSDEPTYGPKEVDTRAVILSNPEPPYTEEARKNEIAGAVLLEAVLSSSGEVRDIKVLRGLPYGLTENALKAVMRIKFKPAIKDGHPVSQRMKFEYNFNLYDKMYFGDRSKMVYYEQGCSDYSKIALSHKVYFTSRKEAKKAGYKKAKDRCP